MNKPRASMAAVAICMTIALPAQGNEPDGLGPFADVDGSAHEADVAALWAAGITSGCDDWLFCPQDPVTRGEMAALLTRALELEVAPASTFEDTAGSTFAADIESLAAVAITHGCAPELFCPDREVTRAQMASFLTRAFDLPVDTGADFDDAEGNTHEAAIGALAAAGITRGCDADSFCPDQVVTRQQMASFLARALDLPAPSELPEIPEEVSDALDELSWPTGPGAEGWRGLVEEHFAAEDVDRALRIMACESKGDPHANNPYSGASGLFQHMPNYWSERSTGAGYGGESIFDPVANVAVAAWLVYDYPGGGWHHWVCS